MTRYAPTFIDKFGARVLMRPNQARYHFDTATEAQLWLAEILDNTSEQTLAQIYGNQALGKFGVIAIDCWDFGDAKRSIFDVDKAPLL